MSLSIQPYRQEHEPAVQSFNQRLRAAGADPSLSFYKNSIPHWLPPLEGSPLRNEYFLALEDGAVRGAYALKYERFYLGGNGEFTVACYHHPLSEGIVNRRYSTVGGLLLRDALLREPMLYALGMGGLDRPLPQMLKGMGWSLHVVPFYFRVVHPVRFLRQMNELRQSPLKRWLLDLAAFTGTGWAAIKLAQGVRRLGGIRSESFEAAEIDTFADWTETLWLGARDSFRLASVRNYQTLARLYPASENHLIKLRVSHKGKPLGWAVVGERRKDPKMGDLRVGSFVDCWARPEHAPSVALAATEALEKNGVDLIFSNQSHMQWGRALRACGFFQAASNFIFAASKKLSASLQNIDPADFHLIRANGDGLPRNF